ncbi:MAG: ABC transporter substrate-binding protein [Sporichthyaceae bacterium]
MTISRRSAAVPVVASLALILAACGSSDDDQAAVAQQPPQEAAPAAKVLAEDAPAAEAKPVEKSAPQPAAKAAVKTEAAEKAAPKAPAAKDEAKTAKAPVAKAAGAGAVDQQIYDAKNGATDIGVTKDQIKLGSINMYGMALGNLITQPMVRGNLAAASAINNRGGVLGRRLSGVDWATASIHDDLKQFKLPYVGAWAYSQTEWQDPYMFPTHMSMIHEAMAGANWVKNVVKPKTYGLICLTSPEMQLACKEVAKILDASGAKLVKKSDVSVSETSMSSQVLAMRAANPDHIVHYVINPATMIKFMVESQQQGYYPPGGISGNHLAGEVLGAYFGTWPVGRYWTNTTYKLWGAQFIATMTKYARANIGGNHHIVQAGYTGVNVLALAAKAVGPNLTRERMMAELGNGQVWKSDADLDQRFSYAQSERTGTNWDKQMGQGREFMYKYSALNTRSNPDGSPNGFQADPDQHVIYTWR